LRSAVLFIPVRDQHVAVANPRLCAFRPAVPLLGLSISSHFSPPPTCPVSQLLFSSPLSLPRVQPLPQLHSLYNDLRVAHVSTHSVLSLSGSQLFSFHYPPLGRCLRLTPPPLSFFPFTTRLSLLAPLPLCPFSSDTPPLPPSLDSVPCPPAT